MSSMGTPHESRTASRLFDLFRMVAIIEGVTTILLFLVAMPVKYMLGNPLWVQIMGPVHGYAFLAYVVLMVVALRGRGWRVMDWLRTFVASLFPFGTFLNEPFLRRRRAAESNHVRA